MTNALLVGLLAVAALIVVSRVTRDETISMPGTGTSAASSGSVESLIRSGRKIDAIKRMREETGLGLKDAKDEVESLARRLASEGGDASR